MYVIVYELDPPFKFYDIAKLVHDYESIEVRALKENQIIICSSTILELQDFMLDNFKTNEEEILAGVRHVPFEGHLWP